MPDFEFGFGFGLDCCSGLWLNPGLNSCMGMFHDLDYCSEMIPGLNNCMGLLPALDSYSGLNQVLNTGLGLKLSLDSSQNLKRNSDKRSDLNSDNCPGFGQESMPILTLMIRNIKKNRTLKDLKIWSKKSFRKNVTSGMMN